MVKVSMITGVGCVGALFAAEHLGPPEWKPSTMIGAFGGKEQTAQILASLEAARAMTAMQEEEKARALQEVEVLRANQDRLTRAYQAEFDRGTELIRAGAAAAQEVLRAPPPPPKPPEGQEEHGDPKARDDVYKDGRDRPADAPKGDVKGDDPRKDGRDRPSDVKAP